jgi:hypothetical protein
MNAHGHSEGCREDTAVRLVVPRVHDANLCMYARCLVRNVRGQVFVSMTFLWKRWLAQVPRHIAAARGEEREQVQLSEAARPGGGRGSRNAGPSRFV